MVRSLPDGNAPSAEHLWRAAWELEKAYIEGKISLDEYRKGTENLIEAFLKERRAVEETTDAIRDKTDATREATAAAEEHADAAVRAGRKITKGTSFLASALEQIAIDSGLAGEEIVDFINQHIDALARAYEVGGEKAKRYLAGLRKSVGQLAEEIKPFVDAILLDSSVRGKSGGTGTIHNWTISRSITKSSSLPVILAGGLHHGNVAEAVRIVGPYAVDTASGAEINGKKDEEMIRLFIKNARCQ